MATLEWHDYLESEEFDTKAEFDSSLQKNNSIKLLLNDPNLTLYISELSPKSIYCIAIGATENLLGKIRPQLPSHHSPVLLRLNDKGLEDKQFELINNTYTLVYNVGKKNLSGLRRLDDYSEVVDEYALMHDYHPEINKEELEQRLRKFNLQELRADGATLWLEDMRDSYETSFFSQQSDPKKLLDLLRKLGSFEMELDTHLPACEYLYANMKQHCTYECSLYRLK